ncbi:uncharacterized protein LOC130494489 [Raphanus sativus]|uniref:Uncharacterized protein LOC130494489 n=1 Tax=Raphanus sativus TaxID=3726 RepID=A0A9W3D8D8_RAPSA|nr:uncharacterized protein LOC130494489 [Raphanus sativus]
MENVLLASELVKDYHKDSVSPRCAMKIDISKAFDSVQWSFLLNGLLAMGFPERFIHWIKLCITSPSFSVQVNGELAGYFQSARGLRQGCSLSPYLFVLCMNVLSLKIDKAMREKKFSPHPRCKSLDLTHLCFADDLIVFVEGSKESVEGALMVFNEFEVWSGLSISLEKSTIFMAGISEVEKSRILNNFPFSVGDLPVRYLGLPLMTKAMKRQDYLPLLERIRGRISTWTSRFLSYAGRLQLIKSVLVSIVNFWSAVFRFPSCCIKEIEQLCAAFLWSGPELKTTSAKVAWQNVSKPTAEGGLGIRSLKEVNLVCGLKLIWRMLTGDSLWSKWVQTYLLKKKSFWEIKETTQIGSWIFKKLLKLREVAKSFHMKAVGNGKHTSFWYEKWSDLGVMYDLLGDRGVIDLGIRREATVEEVINNTRRRRRHRRSMFYEIEKELESIRSQQSNEAQDVHMWREITGFKTKFSSHETWQLSREAGARVPWGKSIWFSQATPKFAFIAWLAMRDRLSTMDRISCWNQGVVTTCVLCKTTSETRNHLFFECSFSSQVWELLTKGILHRSFSTRWVDIVRLITLPTMEKKKRFCLQYAFQATLYVLWRERNKRHHGDKALPMLVLTKLLDKSIRNKLSLVQSKGVKGYEGILQYWFSTRM